MAEAQTHETHLNVFEHFEPKVPETHRSPQITFCANLHPALQASVLQQASPRRLSMLDSMNLWIDIAKDSLLDVMRSVDLVIINDGEVRMLADDENLVRAARKVLEMIGVKTLVVKRGEHGVIAFHGEDIIYCRHSLQNRLLTLLGVGTRLLALLLPTSQQAKVNFHETNYGRLCSQQPLAPVSPSSRLVLKRFIR